MPAARKRATQLLLFAAALMLAHLTTAHDLESVRQALLWLPSGVGVAGCVLLGTRTVWVVVTATLATRLVYGYEIGPAIPASLGSGAEALIGAWLLQSLHLRDSSDRLRNVVTIYAVAMIAPAGSLLFSLVSRGLFAPDMSLFEAWGGWWRMNAIGILLVVPLALAWSDRRHQRGNWSPVNEALASSLIAVAHVLFVSLFVAPGVPAVMMLSGTLIVCFLAAVRNGARGATATSLVSALAIALPAGLGSEPFRSIPFDERHEVVQLILVGLASLPLLFSALLAERDSNAERWMASEGLGQALLRILPDATYRMNDDSVIVDAVLPKDPALPGAETLIGRRVDEVVPKPLCDLILEQLSRARGGRPTEVLEYVVQAPDGEHHREVRFVRLPNNETISVARDITERKRAQQQLRLQAEILEMIATARPRSDVFDALVHGVESQIHASKCSILLIQGDRLRLGHAPSLDDAYNAAVDGLPVAEGSGCCGTAAHRNQVVVCEDLHTSPHTCGYKELFEQFGLRSCWSVPIRSNTGSVLGTFAIYHPEPHVPGPMEVALVEQAAVLAGLSLDHERREGLLSSIQYNVSEGLYRSVPGEGFAYVNEAFARLFGYASAAELNSTWRTAEHAQHRESLDRLINETLTARHRELRLHRRDGSTFWALVSTSVQFHDDDAELVCDGSITDVTERRQLEDQLRQAQKMEAVGQLAGGVAHDFNNLLTAITGFAEAVHNDLPPDSDLRDDVDQILIAGKRATTLTRQLLAFGRRQVLAPRVIELPTVVEEIGDMTRRLIGEHIELVQRGNDSSVRAKVDRGQFEQVIVNLVINARDAMPRGGRIEISTDVIDVQTTAQIPHAELAPGRYAVLRVADDGNGMPPEVRARAFDPFFTTKGPGRGTGLGLSTVYGIIKQSGGTVTIDSTEGQGTTMTVYLPFADELPRLERAVVVPRPARRNGTILVVEDEPFVLELAQRALLHAGHKVLRAKDGSDALTMFAEHQDEIDAIVSDIVMPQMSGPEMARKLTELDPSVRILFMSGYAEDSIELDGETRTGFLHKPFTASQLIEHVDNLLADSSTHDAGAPSES